MMIPEWSNLPKPTSKPLRILAVIEQFNWPIREGSTTIAYHFTKALRKLGHSVDLYTAHSGGSTPDVPVLRIPSDPTENRLEAHLCALTRRFHASPFQVVHLRNLSRQQEYDVCFGIGLGSCPYLISANARTRFWLLGDNPLRNACLFAYLEGLRSPVAALREFNTLGRQALFLQRHPQPLDGVTWVTAKDQRWARLYPGTQKGMLFPNGVDFSRFGRFDPPPDGRRLAFWGNLAYYNNVHAVEWFYHNVFSTLYRQDHMYRFVIAGSYPDDRICRIAENPGVHLRENPPDMDECLSDCGVAVFPFKLGTGIKNKILESAAMGKYSIVSSCIPLDFSPNPSLPFEVCQTATDWTRSLAAVAARPRIITERSAHLRNWVKEFHDWEKIVGNLLQAVRLKLREKEDTDRPVRAGSPPSAA
ncbi:MAG: glycosyltransferase [Bdellovibrionales bacterium]|nr:glycosyltransferase [Bdellovibrionales bacterium]